MTSRVQSVIQSRASDGHQAQRMHHCLIGHCYQCLVEFDMGHNVLHKARWLCFSCQRYGSMSHWEYTHMLWRVQMLETAKIKGESLYCVPAITGPFDICSRFSNTGTGLFSTLCIIIMSFWLGTAGLKVHQPMHKLPLTARSDIMTEMHRQVVSYHAQQGILDLPYWGWSSCVLLMALRKDQSDHCCYAIDRCYLWASCCMDP